MWQDFCMRVRHFILRRKFRVSTCTEIPPGLIIQPGWKKQEKCLLVKKEVNLKNNKQPCWTNSLHSSCIIFENETGLPITPYKECMIDGSESPNTTSVARVLIQGLQINKIGDITWLFVLNVGKLKRLTPTPLSTHLPHSADYPTDYSADYPMDYSHVLP